MAELKEIFEMVTHDTEPKQDAWREQEERQRRDTRSRRVRAYTAVAAVIIVVLVAVAFLGEYGASQTPAASVSPSPLLGITSHFLVDVSTGERTAAAPIIPGGRLLAVSPDGRTFAYNTCCTTGDALYLVNSDGTDDRAIAEGSFSGYAPTWSADGSTLVFQGRNPASRELGGIYAYDVARQESSEIVDFGRMRSGRWIVPPDISPDGRTLLYHLPSEDPATWDLWTAPVTGGSPTLIRRNAGFASYTPDGSIVYLDHPQEFTASSIWIMDPDGTGARRLVQGATLEWPRVSPNGTQVAYDDGAHTFVVNVSDLRIEDLGPGIEPAWVDNDTLIVG